MFEIKAITQTANKATEEILDGKDLNIAELNTSFMQQQRLLQKK